MEMACQITLLTLVILFIYWDVNNVAVSEMLLICTLLLWVPLLLTRKK